MRRVRAISWPPHAYELVAVPCRQRRRWNVKGADADGAAHGLWVLVRTMTGIPGMNAGVQIDVGARLRVRVTAIDRDKKRFAADRLE